MKIGFTEDTEANHKSNLTNVIAQDIEKFKKSVNKNGGYYIARYEAGVRGTTMSNNSNSYTIDGYTLTKDSQTAGYLVSKSGVGVWNKIKQNNAAMVSRNMYNGNKDGINSDLANSYSWDTAIIYIQKCGRNSKYSQNCIDSYSEEVYDTESGIISVISKSEIQVSGKYSDQQCKINDMSANVYEWTTETCLSQGPGRTYLSMYIPRSIL